MKSYVDYLSQDFPLAYMVLLGCCLSYKLSQYFDFSTNTQWSVEDTINIFLAFNVWFVLIAFYKWWRQS